MARRVAYAIVVVGLVVFPLVAVFGPVRGGAAGSRTGVSPVVVVLGVVLLLALLVVLASALRESRRFLRIAELLATVALGLYVVGLGFSAVEFATGSDSVVFGGPSLQVTTYDIEVEADSGTIFGTTRARRERYTEQWLRRTYGEGATFAQSSMVRLSVERPSAQAIALTLLALLLRYGAALVGLWYLRAILRRAADGAPFDPRNASALRAIAMSVLAGWVSVAWIEPAALRAVVASAGGSGGFISGIHGTLLLIALVVLALAEVWRYGIALQEDAEATV